MSLEVYINDERIELENKTGIGLTFQVGSILNIGSRAGNLTNKFKVPKTLNNTNILSNLSNINANSNIPYQRNAGRIIQNGVELVSDGVSIIESTDNNYNIIIYSGNVSFFDLINSLNVNALNWGSHTYDIPTIIASFGGSTSYIYPIIDYGFGTDSSGNKVELLDNTTLQNADALIPSVYISEVIERAAALFGYELRGNFMTNLSYPRLLLTPNKFGFTKEEVDDENGYAGDLTDTGSVQENIPQGTATLTFYPSVVYNTFTVPSFSGTQFVPPFEMFGVLSFWIHFIGFTQNKPIGHDEPTVTFEILEDAVVIATNTFAYTTGGNTVHKLQIDTDEIILRPTSVYTVNIFVTVLETALTPNYKVHHRLAESSFSLQMSRRLPYGISVDVDSLYDKEVGTILKDMVNMYGLVIQTDNVKKQVSLNPLDDLTDNIVQAKDWSDKIDLSKGVSVKYQIGSYGQVNNLKYNPDEDVETDTGKGSFDVDNVNLINEMDIVKLDAAASIKVSRIDNRDVPSFPFQNEIGEAFEKKKSRYLLLDKEDFDLDFQNTINSDTGTATTNIPLCYFNKDGKLDSLDFPSLITANYSTLVAMLDKVKFISASYLLKEIDVVNLDFTIPIFLDVHTENLDINGYFYINKITNFKQDTATRVDLIRL